ncbi:LacI family transcriptional regulator [Clostridium saccharoperbutylacetonicum]|jgi:LacI family transcriptional regulator|uniref:Transcriptional regulator, LacI family n=1 Tax=Clostridium saccharoperbutylacetonicum N1-4(HMT) TaxID=931276 RepID=M1N6I7_9CLOT|nr:MULTISPECIES: LacI family DNA-binding transcriptional regulator [Clostridium]AGF59022.1 transcriptional regulator, LacI family [Clostridium saccharoperbutylacetonicum N1-4(HMT)]NRT60190.1 LacI family transcriptional regulator [Clostridium saccharoperbutylacetonicum]NSB23502.1 LacI family transcriptional regulator [Clostridium saccharoperbutylacetonicum]NSB42872.1 LacI family transcriptional regulator [Clostridium saccharoperbutylacetonicum]
MAKAIKLADIAEVLKVSKVTVSKALSDKDGVSDELREKIKKVAAEMGYRQNSIARSLRDGYTYNIGVLIPEGFVEMYHSFYWELYQNVLNALTQKSYYGIMEVVNREDENNNVVPRMLQDSKVDGIIVMGELKKEYVEFLNSLDDVPVVMLDTYDKHIDYDTVTSDNYYGMYLLTDYLIEMGHRDILFVGNPRATSSIQDRFLGFTKALLERGIEYTSNSYISDREIGKKELNFELPEKMPTAFACNCDSVAYLLIKKLQDKGYKVPEDISVVGFDNYLITEISDLGITTFEVDMKTMAETAVDVILKKVRKVDYKPARRVICGKIVIKDTVKELKK